MVMVLDGKNHEGNIVTSFIYHIVYIFGYLRVRNVGDFFIFFSITPQQTIGARGLRCEM